MSGWEHRIKPPLREVGSYVPGPSLDELMERHGLGPVDKLNWNEGLWGPLPGVLEAVAAARERLSAALREGGMAPMPSSANFVLVDLGVDDAELTALLMRRGILIRPGTELGLPGWARITAGPDDVMDRAATALLEARAELLETGAAAAP
jgi:histidinol-phosphate/aromatic aminotransferase/cobyric acid decarboxylase-like protein